MHFDIVSIIRYFNRRMRGFGSVAVNSGGVHIEAIIAHRSLTGDDQWAHSGDHRRPMFEWWWSVSTERWSSQSQVWVLMISEHTAVIIAERSLSGNDQWALSGDHRRAKFEWWWSVSNERWSSQTDVWVVMIGEHIAVIIADRSLSGDDVFSPPNQQFIVVATSRMIGIHRSSVDGHRRPSSAFQSFPMPEVPLSRCFPSSEMPGILCFKIVGI